MLFLHFLDYLAQGHEVCWEFVEALVAYHVFGEVLFEAFGETLLLGHNLVDKVFGLLEAEDNYGDLLYCHIMDSLQIGEDR